MSPVDKRAAGPWGQVGSYDPKRKTLYWSVSNPNPYTRLTRHGAADAVPTSAPADLFSNSTVALDVTTGKLNWYYQELPGDDWDADHNHERILVHTRVNPDPKQVRWINPAIKPGSEHDIVLTTAEGGGMFAVEQATGQFLWSRPFPYDDPQCQYELHRREDRPHTRQFRTSSSRRMATTSSAATTTRARSCRPPTIRRTIHSMCRSTISACR